MPKFSTGSLQLFQMGPFSIPSQKWKMSDKRKCQTMNNATWHSVGAECLCPASGGRKTEANSRLVQLEVNCVSQEAFGVSRWVAINILKRLHRLYLVDFFLTQKCIEALKRLKTRRFVHLSVGLSASSALTDSPTAACLNLLPHSSCLTTTPRHDRKKANVQPWLLQRLRRGHGDTGWHVWVRQEHSGWWIMTRVFPEDRSGTQSWQGTERSLSLLVIGLIQTLLWWITLTSRFV